MGELLSEKAYELIKEKIKSYAGQNISVRRMAKEINIGYSPAREACSRLTQEGLIKLVPGVGYYVPKLKEKYLDEIFEYRKLVEKYVFINVFDSLTPEHIAILNDCIDKQINYLKEEDLENFHKYDKNFHLLFFKLYKNNILINQMNNIMDRSYFCSYNTMDSMEKNKVIDALEEHKEMVKYITTRDKKMAIKKLVEHIKNSELRIKEGYYYKLNRDLAS